MYQYKILIDSCGDLNPELRADERIVSIPLEIDVDGYRIVDDETFDQADFLRRVAEFEDAPKSSCPSPDAYMQAMKGPQERVYVITLSSPLSGSFNSAMLGKDLYECDHADDDDFDKKIYVFDSKSACVGETIIALHIMDLEEQGLPYEEIIAKTEEFIAGMHTYFVLESLEALRKNGRLSNLKAMVASRLKIKPVMSAKDGVIFQLDQTIGLTRALESMLKHLTVDMVNPEQKRVGITHCNCPERAAKLKEQIEKIAPFKEIVVVDAAGIASLYASDGGIVVVL